jgi:hypothetical protein
VAFGFLLFGSSALAMPIDPLPASAANVQSAGIALRTPDQRTASAANVQSAGIALRTPDQRTASAGNVQSAAIEPALPVAGGGLSAFVIVLISVGGAMALAGVAYTVTRAVHRHGDAVS